MIETPGIVLLMMPSPPTWSTGPAAMWVTAAGWARALTRAVGTARLITPMGNLGPEDAEHLVAQRRVGASTPSFVRRVWGRARSHIPETLHVGRKDARDIARGLTFLRNGFLPTEGVRLVWQHHELFQNAGTLVARRANVPLIQFVDAPIVWEAARWGLRRPWGRALERAGETPQLRAANVVCCVSEEVAEAAIALGANPRTTVVTPCAVDVDRFRVKTEEGRALRNRYGISPSAIVVGWIGSFRRFHGLELLLEAVALAGRRSSLHLLLVGDGLERKRMESLAAQLNLENVTFCGLVGRDEVPVHLSAMDMAVVTVPDRSAFHYSPLKLKEYMAAGRAIIAGAAGETATLLSHGKDAILVAPGDVRSIADAIDVLAGDASLRVTLGDAALKLVQREGTWDAAVKVGLDVLRAQGWRL